MRRHLHYLIALVFLAALPASAQTTLPDNFAGWTSGVRAVLQQGAVMSGDDTDSLIGQRSSAALKEFGFVSGEQVSYARGTDSMRVNLYRMKDASGAYGEYFYLRDQGTLDATLYHTKDVSSGHGEYFSMRTPELVSSNLAQYSAMSADRALVLDGNVVLDIRGEGLPRKEAALKSLIASVGLHAQQGGLPMLLQHMPQKGKIEGTDYYVLGPNVLYQVVPVSQDDWLGFSQDTEAELAKYRVDGAEVTLLIADFPTPQLAAKKLAELQRAFNVNGSKPDANGQPLFAKRSLTLLAITVGAHSQSEADVLLNQVHTTTEVTWNEPTFSLTEPSFPAMIVGVFVGTGVICLFAIISSVAFGGLRLAIKRLYPNKVFDRESEIQILQLGLTSKPINAEDFYSLGGPGAG
jgi:hypothetical protein